jgi:hypothetical protein
MPMTAVSPTRTIRRGQRHRQACATGLLAAVWVLLGAGPGAAGTLDTPGQLRLETELVAVMASAPVRDEMRRLRPVLEADPQAATPGGAATIDRALEATAAAVAHQVLNDDPARPVLVWGVSAPHDWHGLAVPGSGYGIDNPDNVYRMAPVDGRLHYEVRGRMPPQAATQLSFTLTAAPPPGPFGREGPPVVAGLSDIRTAPDGSFVITIGPEAADGRPNHLQTTPDTRRLVVRDTFAYWTRELPAPLEIRRLDGPAPGVPPALPEQALRVAVGLRTQVPGWADYFRREVYSAPANTVPAPIRRDGGWGMATMAHFRLAEDEALVVRLDPRGARYLGFQLSDPWGIAPDYVTHASSRNNRQMQANADGTVTYVISLRDPGVANWLDTVGLRTGMLCIRWQGLPAGETGQRAVLAAGVVRLADIGKIAPGLAAVDPDMRRQELAARAAAYARRLAD